MKSGSFNGSLFSGCTTIFLLLIIGTASSLVIGVVSCNENRLLKERMEELENDKQKPDENIIEIHRDFQNP